jgi:dihydroflavonol-4-reductase
VLVRALLAQGRNVRAVTHTRRREVSLQGLGVEIRSMDIRRPETMAGVFDGAEVVYHLAAKVSVAPAQAREMYRVNVRGTQNVIDACRRSGVQRLVYASSTDALDEKSEIVHRSPVSYSGYGRSKARATAKVIEAVRQGLDAVILYPSSVVGPFDFKPTQIGQAILDYAHRRIPAYLDGGYDFVDVRDVAQGMIEAASRGRAGEGYILSGTRLSLHEFMLLLEELTGVKAPAFKLPLGLARVLAAIAPAYYALRRTEPLFTPYTVSVLTSNSTMTSDKARRDLGYTTRPIRETLADTVQWFRENGRL